MMNCVCECNRTFNSETLHPQVSLIDTARPCIDRELCTDCYSVSLRCACSCKQTYGRMDCDFTDAVMLFSRPGDEIDLHTGRGRMLIFHPDIARCTPLEPLLRDCSFFNYNEDEALHLSCAELRLIDRCLDSVGYELQRGVDDYSQDIICAAIEMLMNQCRRLYHRQFITRHDVSVSVIARINAYLDDYFMSGKAKTCGLPHSLPSGRVGEGASYLNDMLREETGHATADYIQLRRMHTAKIMLIAAERSISDIATTLGFCSTNCFASVFKKLNGCTPEEYRGG